MLCPIRLPERFGGIEIIVEGVTGALMEMGAAVTFVSASDKLDAGERPCSQQLRHIVVPGSFDSSASVADTNARANRVAEGLHFDVVYCNDWFFGPAAVSIAKAQQVPLVSIMHLCKVAEYAGAELSGGRARIAQFQQDLVCASDAVLAYSDYMVQLARVHWGVMPEKLFRLRCGFAEARGLRLVSQSGPPRPLRLLYAGRLAPEKDVDVLVRALDKAGSSHPTTLRIVGSGAQEASLRRLAIDLRVEDLVEWFPFTQDAMTLEQHFASADALVLPSRFEPFGVVLLEAIAREIPVISSNAGGPIEIVTPGTGYVFPVGEANALADRISSLISDPTQARIRARRALDDCRERFSWKHAHETLRAVQALVEGATA